MGVYYPTWQNLETCSLWCFWSDVFLVLLINIEGYHDWEWMQAISCFCSKSFFYTSFSNPFFRCATLFRDWLGRVTKSVLLVDWSIIYSFILNSLSSRKLNIFLEMFLVLSSQHFLLRDLRFLVWKCNMERPKPFFLSSPECIHPPFQRDRHYLDGRYNQYIRWKC